MTVIFVLIVIVLAFVFSALLIHMGGARLFGYAPPAIQAAVAELSKDGNNIVLFKREAEGEKIANLGWRERNFADLPNGRYTMVLKHNWETLDPSRTYDTSEVTADKDDPGVYITFTKAPNEVSIVMASSGWGQDKYNGLYVADKKCFDRIAVLYEVYAHSHYVFLSSI